MNAYDLSARLSELLRREHESMADFLIALADFDRRHLWRDLGHANLFSFLHRDLGLSKGAAFYRKTAAELVRRCPEVIEPLRDGRLCFTSVVELAKVLTPENRGEVLPRFFHRSKREAREVVAELKPVESPPRREVVTAVRGPAPSTAAAVVELPVAATDTTMPAKPPESAAPCGWPAEHLDANSPRPAAHAPSSREVRGESVEPLSADLRRLHFNVSRRFLEKLDAARDALSHSHPGAGTEEILEAGLDLLLARSAKRKGLVQKPLAERRPSQPDHIPAAVKRAVWIRDGGRCQYPLDSGGICGSTYQLEFDHRKAQALGGRPTIKNIRLLCRAHNQRAAREVFGDALMDRYTRRSNGEIFDPASVEPPGTQPPRAAKKKRSG
ncbi:HNH endonuclease signature motif containing protein [Anaeromyxobacter oryzisoli]|uniref:HNH endonuclease signature motif containing protein n=1 Tax=Anaeromyxobacter oryzisoli TaxID=2925408 RepID=UPI001F59F25D|nr:HNH endonuclease signature motif containing protein [Anaeromyxobacter sp. SG63]